MLIHSVNQDIIFFEICKKTFALTIMFKKFSSIFNCVFSFLDKSKNESTVKVEKTQPKSESFVTCLQLQPFDNNLQYKDDFKKNKDSTVHFTRTFYRRPLFKENSRIVVGTTVGTLSNEEKNGRYEQKFNILYLFDKSVHLYE